MNNRSFEIIEEAISNGLWTWLELDTYSNSLYLEFENLQLLSKAIVNKFKPVQESVYNDYRGELAIRFGTNIYLAILYDDEASFDFLDLESDFLDSLLSSDSKLSDSDSYFYREFKKEIRGFKFQDLNYLANLISKYDKKKVLVELPDNKDSYDFLLSFELDNFAIVVKGDFLSFFNDFESLNDEDIKRSSNDWILYYLEYWNKKGTDEEYDEDLLCEKPLF
ncbi:MAG: hypothetical protein IKV87_01415 [Methanobrevibacter sp.]|nr:hypothetical protein [Methanobrevibacter sp.]